MHGARSAPRKFLGYFSYFLGILSGNGVFVLGNASPGNFFRDATRGVWVLENQRGLYKEIGQRPAFRRGLYKKIPRDFDDFPIFF